MTLNVDGRWPDCLVHALCNTTKDPSEVHPGVAAIIALAREAFRTEATNTKVRDMFTVCIC